MRLFPLVSALAVVLAAHSPAYAQRPSTVGSNVKADAAAYAQGLDLALSLAALVASNEVPDLASLQAHVGLTFIDPQAADVPGGKSILGLASMRGQPAPLFAHIAATTNSNGSKRSTLSLERLGCPSAKPLFARLAPHWKGAPRRLDSSKLRGGADEFSGTLSGATSAPWTLLVERGKDTDCLVFVAIYLGEKNN
jgi:hypothetical protein